MRKLFFIVVLFLIATTVPFYAFASDEITDTSAPSSVQTSLDKINSESAEDNSVKSDNEDLSLFSVDKNTPLVSPALNIIAADFDMAKSGLVSNTLMFTHDDFCRALNLSSVSSITIRSLPASADGRLLLGNTAITEGQSISRANLDLIGFHPASDVKCSALFEFSVDGYGYPIKCFIYTHSEVNRTPEIVRATNLSDVSELHENTPLYSSLCAFDPDGDKIRFEIIKYPKNGLLILNDSEAGAYTYLPRRHFTGEDSFSYVVRDIYGNYSAAATVSLKIKRASSSVVYSDMKGNSAANAALTLAEKNIMLGKESESGWIFEPEGTLTRSEFLTMAMKAAGFSELPQDIDVKLSDADLIPRDELPYIAAAIKLGYGEGEQEPNGIINFHPTRKIKRSEAAVIVDRIINTSSLLGNKDISVSLEDFEDIPSDAQESVKNLNLLGLLRDNGGSINPSDELTREDAALLLCAILKLK